MQPTKQAGFFIKEPSGEWTTVTSPPPRKEVEKKTDHVSKEKLSLDLETDIPYVHKNLVSK